MPEQRRRSLKLDIRYAIGAKAVIDPVICDEVIYRDGWIILMKGDSEVVRYNQAHIVRVQVERGTLDNAGV